MLNLSRRSFLSVGAFGMLSMPQLLQAQDENSTQHKAVINIFLAGGPPHQDMWDIKQDAPSEIRGEFKPISTNVAGIQIGECFPKIASMFDKFTAIRSVVGCKGSHDGYQCMSGWGREEVGFGSQKYPAVGSVASKVLGFVDRSVPVAIGLAEPTQHKQWSEVGSAGYLGHSHKAFQPNNEMMEDLILKIKRDRFNSRKSLLDTLSGLNTVLNNTGTFTEEAFGVLTSSKLLKALDLSKEDPKK